MASPGRPDLTDSGSAPQHQMDERRLSRAEAIALVRRIMAGDYVSETEADAWVESLKRSLGCPHVTDLIFYPGDRGAPTAEEVVERALAYRPIAL